MSTNKKLPSSKSKKVFGVTVNDDLKRAIKCWSRKLSTEDKWTTGVLARDERYNKVPPTSETACQFCLIGARDACLDSMPILKDSLSVLLDNGYIDYQNTVVGKETIGNYSIVQFNDSINTTFKTVRKFINFVRRAVVAA